MIFSFHFLYYLCLNSIFYVLFGFFLFRQSDSVQLCSLVFPTPLITWCVILSESPSVLCCVQFPSYSLVPGFSSPELFSYVVFCSCKFSTSDGVMKPRECAESFQPIPSPKHRSHEALFNSFIFESCILVLLCCHIAVPDNIVKNLM